MAAISPWSAGGSLSKYGCAGRRGGRWRTRAVALWASHGPFCLLIARYARVDACPLKPGGCVEPPRGERARRGHLHTLILQHCAIAGASFSVSIVIREEAIDVVYGPARGAGTCAHAEVPPTESRRALSGMGKGARWKRPAKRSRPSMAVERPVLHVPVRERAARVRP